MRREVVRFHIQGELLVYVDIKTVHMHIYLFMSHALVYVLCLWTIICNILWVDYV
jgi:hypothetical protein